jgi:hypothetical protein
LGLLVGGGWVGGRGRARVVGGSEHSKRRGPPMGEQPQGESVLMGECMILD